MNQKQIKQRLEAAKREIQECEKLLEEKGLPPILWRPAHGTEIPCHLLTASASGTMHRDTKVSPFYAAQQLFRTKAEAERAHQRRIIKMKVLRRIAELNHEQGWVCDFTNHDQGKCSLAYTHSLNRPEIFHGTSHAHQEFPVEHYASSETIKRICKEFTGEELKIFIGVTE